MNISGKFKKWLETENNDGLTGKDIIGMIVMIIIGLIITFGFSIIK